MAVTIEDLNDKMFVPVFHCGREFEGEVNYENAKTYMNLLMEDAKIKMQELFPEVKYKISLLEQTAFKQFYVICTFLIDGKLFYLFNNLTWDLDCPGEILKVNKITQIDNN
jgi:hypothetical protein